MERPKYSYSNIHPNVQSSSGLLGVKRTNEEANALADKYRAHGIRVYIEHAGLRDFDGTVKGALAVYCYPDDLNRVLRESWQWEESDSE